ncbi:aspartyl protease family protein At5g10770-like [Triticum dicoccoides]|uniref:aspartyl protease family protein At5g10770-like n=1 Tax=Triticum dicoccoides TaxID=85692 RepID=UPI00188EB58B|nr:aspartyl protease family protein At5g10770-like [Triticum dicoccoides]
MAGWGTGARAGGCVFGKIGGKWWWLPLTGGSGERTTPTGQSTVPLSHRHGPCAPVPSKERSLSERLRHDVARAGYVHQATGGYGYGLQRSDPAPMLLGDALGSAEYVVTVGIGSPAFGQTLILDTGSHVSWVRCNTQFGTPFDHVERIFDPMASSSYAPFSCSATACAQLGGMWNGCSPDQCQYTVNYQDRSYIAGTYSSDTLTLTGSEAIIGFRFGCSHTYNVDARIDGLLGLGGGVQKH